MRICNFSSISSYHCSFTTSRKRFAITNPNRIGASCTTTTHHKWNVSKDLTSNLEGHNSSEKLWVDYKEKMGEIKQLLLQHSNLDEEMNGKESLILVDAIQRVGMEHHFDEEIEMILGRLYYSTNNFDFIHHDLYYVSLHFRLLRNQGYYVPPDALSVFKADDGKFKEKLRQDIGGLMELHEAAQLGLRDEVIIDEVEEFSRLNLNKWLEKMNDDDLHKMVVKNSLRQPQHKNIARLTARNYIEGVCVKGCKKGWEKTLFEVAKMDFLIGDLLHQDELLQISKWCDNVGICEKLERARRQPVKWYTWAMASLINNPSLRLQRIELTKAIAFIYLIDDIFDLYGTIDDLTLYTQAINRWEYDAIITLPEYMRNSYKNLLDTINGIAQKVEQKYATNPIDSLKATWGSLSQAMLVEARWFRSRELPTAKEYLENGKVSSGIHIVMVHLFYLLGLGRKQHPINLNDTCTLTSTVATILRLYDDLGSAKDEHQDGSDGSYIKYCMNEEADLSEKEARRRVEDMLSNQWKVINEECLLRLNHSSVSCFRRGSLNLARMVPLMYTYDENQGLPLLKEHINNTKLFN
ncbi:(3S,6E)-nerolidol synthase 1-like [Salvia miltiorrhiza]|uniref:(3S,6E)-nerolidol synthase 1-like n=1 Tax=Salvia miltiorrhiza TaxID=226208 RepID=UPI0025AD25F1|nr:(3S,6E)-nerolidol synthase 1-like [Salvia miltiorrhiza]